MQYEKGTFTVVPNISLLEGKDPILQILYVWMCKYANENGECFPSIGKLSKCCGCSESSIKLRIKDLQDMGIVERERRYKNNEEITSKYLIRVGREITQVGRETPTELNILISNKEDVSKLLEDNIYTYKSQVECLWYMIELGYSVEKTLDSLLDNINWVSDKAKIYGYRLVDGSIDWGLVKQKFDKRYEYHKGKKDKITNYKTSVIRFLDQNYSRGRKQKK